MSGERRPHGYMPTRAKPLSDDDCGRDLATGGVMRPRCQALGVNGDRCANPARYVDCLDAAKKYCVTHARLLLCDLEFPVTRR